MATQDAAKKSSFKVPFANDVLSHAPNQIPTAAYFRLPTITAETLISSPTRLSIKKPNFIL